ncbi:MAG: sporulation protein YunB [Acutalibacteraceae bacterium]|nr:sporulation protein YunB [Acutalibacteraceae bacterium]
MWRNERLKSILLRWLILFLFIIIFLAVFLCDATPLIFTYAKSRAETILLDAANTAVLNVLEKTDTVYSDISNISYNSNGDIKGIEINTNSVNKLKSLISNEISKIVGENDSYIIKIPFGTLLGNEYITGYGPQIKFKMRLTETAILDFESKFIDAGINNVLHQIIINIDINANVLMVGYTKGFKISTSALAAQTVIAGNVPDSFTQVEEHPGDDIADEILNYAEID